MQHEMAELPRLAEAGGVFFLSLSPDDRAGIAYTIERLINMLDAMEVDPDLEPSLAGFDGGPTDDREGDLDLDEWDGNPDDEDGADAEFNLGWEKGSMPYDQTHIAMYGKDEVEVENEHGGDINDEPHDAEEDCCGAKDDWGTGNGGCGGARIAADLLRSKGLPAPYIAPWQ
ncbi:MAG: hypothetical protein J0H34_22465 [Rhizobiales bacterium]|nr:hypothetical protein [Hyphomicrobiales bacterium]